MLYRCFLFISFVVAGSAFAQPRYGILTEPTCWTTPGNRDSSITRIVLISSADEKKTLRYLDQYANDVYVSADSSSFQSCYCEELPGYVYPPPGGINVQSITLPDIDPEKPACLWGIVILVEFYWEPADVTASFDGQNIINGFSGQIYKDPTTGALFIFSQDQFPLENCYAASHTFVITINNAYGNATQTVTVGGGAP